jgi:dTDP-4-dehydrorhamnose reductase
VNDFSYESVSLADFDISNFSSVYQHVVKGKYDVVINCASKTNVDECEIELDRAFSVNALGARNLAIACERCGSKLVHFSTDYVFDGTNSVLYREWDFPNPINVYGKSKLLSETYVKMFCKEHFIIRTAWLYGAKGENFVKTILRISREKGELKVVSDQCGSPTNVAELVHHIIKLLPTEGYGIYHATGSGKCSRYEFACKIIEYAGISTKIKPCSTEEFLLPAKRPHFSALDNMVLRNTVGDDFLDWDKSLKNFIEDGNVS